MKYSKQTNPHRQIVVDGWLSEARGWGGGVRSDEFLSRGFPLEVMKMFWTEIEVVLNALNSSESFTLKC